MCTSGWACFSVLSSYGLLLAPPRYPIDQTCEISSQPQVLSTEEFTRRLWHREDL